MKKSVEYVINRKNEIIGVRGEWDRFASENRATRPLDDNNVLGKPLLSFFKGEETKSLYLQVIENVRLTEKSCSFPFNCDSPEKRRRMVMKIHYLDGQNIKIETYLKSEELRASMACLNSQIDRSSSAINICSICRRVSNGENQWFDVETAA